MSIYGIASIWNGKQQVGIRLLDSDKKQVRDMDNKTLLELLHHGVEVVNIKATNNGIEWIQGIMDRYPSVDVTNNSSDNINSIVVLGLIDNGSIEREYSITNYLGNVVTISESRLIEYGKKYTIANCKIVNRDGSDTLVSLNGAMNKIPGEINIRYDTNENRIIVDVPETGLRKLVITKRIAYNISNPLYTEISVNPPRLASTIKHLVLPDTIDCLGDSLLDNLYGLEVLECAGSINKIDRMALKSLNNLKRVYMYDIDSNYMSLFKHLDKLETVEISKGIKSLPRGSFRNCRSIDVDKVLNSRVLTMRDYVFDSCNQITDVVIPSTTKVISSRAFSKCKNIKSFRISSVDLEIVPYRDYDNKKGDYVTQKLLMDSPNAVVYCPYEYPESRLEYIADHVKIIKDEPIQENNEVSKNKILKAQVLGLSVNDGDVASNIDETISALRVASSKDVKDGMIEAVRYLQADRRLCYGACLVKLDSLFIRVSIGGYYGALGSLVASNVGKDYAILVFKRVVIAVPISKEKLLERIDINQNKDYRDVIVRNDGELVIPTLRFKASYSDIKNISEEDGEVYVTSKRKGKHRLSV